MGGINDIGLGEWVKLASADPRFNRELDTVDALLRYVAGLPEHQQHPQEQQHTPYKSHGPGEIWLNLNGMPADSMFNGVYFNMSRAEQLQKLQVECMHRIGQQAPNVRIDLINRQILFLKDVHFYGDCARIVEEDAGLVEQLALVARTVQLVTESHNEPPFHFVVEGH